MDAVATRRLGLEQRLVSLLDDVQGGTAGTPASRHETPPLIVTSGGADGRAACGIAASA